jgi:hypothetical protein
MPGRNNITKRGEDEARSESCRQLNVVVDCGYDVNSAAPDFESESETRAVKSARSEYNYVMRADGKAGKRRPRLSVAYVWVQITFAGDVI